MSYHGPGQDPGWVPNWRIALRTLVPGMGARAAASAPNALVATRGVFLTFAVSLVWVGLVVLLVAGGTEDPSLDPAVAAVGALVLGFAGVAVSRMISVELPCGDPQRLIGVYRTTFFLRIAFADSAALLGFVGVFLSGSPLPYFVGAIPAAVGFALLAPTRANLEREDDGLRARGCADSLYATLLAPSPAAEE